MNKKLLHVYLNCCMPEIFTSSNSFLSNWIGVLMSGLVSSFTVVLAYGMRMEDILNTSGIPARQGTL